MFQPGLLQLFALCCSLLLETMFLPPTASSRYLTVPALRGKHYGSAEQTIPASSSLSLAVAISHGDESLFIFLPSNSALRAQARRRTESAWIPFNTEMLALPMLDYEYSLQDCSALSQNG